MKVQFSSKRNLLIITVCLIIGIYFLWPIISNDRSEMHPSDSVLVESESKETSLLSPYLVYISGAVQHPGLYALERSSSVAELIQTAGGLLPYAGTDGINLANTVNSGEHIHIPFNYSGNPELLLQKPKININTATVEELKTLPGIGEAMAKRIEEYRQREGSFSTIEDIKKIKGIGDAMFKKLGDKISVS